MGTTATKYTVPKYEIPIQTSAFNADIVVNTAGSIVYVSNTSKESATAYAAPSGDVLWTQSVPEARRMAMGEGGALVYVAGHMAVYALDASTGETVRTLPVHMPISCVAYHSGSVFVGRSDLEIDTDRVVVLHADTGDAKTSFAPYGDGSGQLRSCTAMNITSDGKHIVVAMSSIGQALSVFTTEGAFVKRLAPGFSRGGQLDFCFAPNGILVIADADAGRVMILHKDGSGLYNTCGDLLQDEESAPIAVCHAAEGLWVLQRHACKINVF